MNLKKLFNIKNWKELYNENREIALYIIFGALTTIISFAVYYLMRLFFLYTTVPVIISWIVSVTFAYVTNRIFVFRSKAKGFKNVFLEALSFYLGRIFTFFVDAIIMFVFVDLMNSDSMIYEFIIKILSNVIILILNYLISKMLVFRKKRKK